MKKKFILFLGDGWSGTTSLFYTLQDNLQYMHGGYVKESHYLAKYYYNRKKETVVDNLDSMFTFREYLRESISSKQVQQTNLKTFVDPLLKFKFTSSEFLNFILKKDNLENYLNFYLKLSEYSDENYLSVGDFSNTNYLLKKEMLLEVFNLLDPHFHIKVLFIFRDPIRKMWSSLSAYFEDNEKSIFFPKQYSSDQNLVDLIITKYKNISPYANRIKDAYSVFGQSNVHYIIMENFFSNQKNNPEVSKLEKFLNISISIEKICPCAFVPDRGINALNSSIVPDQSTSDHRILSKTDYCILRNYELIANDYSLFQDFHGYLPAEWGRPINYEY